MRTILGCKLFVSFFENGQDIIIAEGRVSPHDSPLPDQFIIVIDAGRGFFKPIASLPFY
jgi:hypothetical protein